MPIYPKSEKCRGCPAEFVGTSYVPGRGPLSAKLALIGQGPGKVEAYQGRPFKGPSGKILNIWLDKAGVPEADIYIDNVVRCWLPKDRKPLAKEVAFCWKAHLRDVLAKMTNLKVICPVGVPAQAPFKIGAPKESHVGATYQVSKESILG